MIRVPSSVSCVPCPVGFTHGCGLVTALRFHLMECLSVYSAGIVYRGCHYPWVVDPFRGLHMRSTHGCDLITALRFNLMGVFIGVFRLSRISWVSLYPWVLPCLWGLPYSVGC